MIDAYMTLNAKINNFSAKVPPRPNKTIMGWIKFKVVVSGPETIVRLVYEWCGLWKNNGLRRTWSWTAVGRCSSRRPV